MLGIVETGVEQNLSLLDEGSWEHDGKKHDIRQKTGVSFIYLFFVCDGVSLYS